MYNDFHSLYKTKELLNMKGSKVILCAVCAFVTVAAAVTAIFIFRNEIAYFLADIKDKIDEKRFRRNGEYADFADV